jgi:hypothetical protein
MRYLRLSVALPMLALWACGGDAVLKCEKGGAYLNAFETPRVRAPEGLDNLDSLREMPLPDASPQSQRPPEGGCLEAPPVLVGDG